MATAFYSNAINKHTEIGIIKLNGEDLSDVILYDDNGDEIGDVYQDFPTNIEQIETAKTEEQTRLDNIPNLKASAKAKLVAGAPLTEEEANTIVL